MTITAHTPAQGRVVATQIGRIPREPWRVAAQCGFGFPTVILSPPVLMDGTPFPTWAWLTCPHLNEAVSALESAGGTAAWAQRIAADPDLAAAVQGADAELRARRAREGADPNPEVGLAGQRDSQATKCLHAHVALALAGILDPIGTEILHSLAPECRSGRCADLAGDAGGAA